MYFVIDIWNMYGPQLAVVALIAFLLAVYFAIVPHEVAHGLAAKWNGDLTAQVNGRLTLNPIAHFDLIGFAMLLFVGFGYAKPVPINPYNFKVPRRGLFTTAIAGVTYNFSAMLLSCFFLALTMFIGPLSYEGALYYLYWFFYFFFYLSASINVMLFLFNIIPLGPLDGFKIIEAYADRENKVVGFLRRYGNYILLALFILHLVVSYLGSYVYLPAWLNYVDILGLYLNYGSMGIAGSIQQLFNMIFNLDISGWALF